MEQTSTWVRIGKTGDFPEGQKMPVSINQRDIILYHEGKAWFAFERKCPHMGAPLDKAHMAGTTITCPHHNVQFSIVTGEIIHDGGYLSLSNLKVFPVKIEGEDVLVHPRQRTVDSWDRGLEM